MAVRDDDKTQGVQARVYGFNSVTQEFEPAEINSAGEILINNSNVQSVPTRLQTTLTNNTSTYSASAQIGSPFAISQSNACTLSTVVVASQEGHKLDLDIHVFNRSASPTSSDGTNYAISYSEALVEAGVINVRECDYDHAGSATAGPTIATLRGREVDIDCVPQGGTTLFGVVKTLGSAIFTSTDSLTITFLTI